MIQLLSHVISASVHGSLVIAAVFASCAKKGGKGFISGTLCCLCVYTTLFAGAVYLPDRAEDKLSETGRARKGAAVG